jgi:hypothetical protein
VCRVDVLALNLGAIGFVLIVLRLSVLFCLVPYFDSLIDSLIH